jgi:hypothetical protein
MATSPTKKILIGSLEAMALIAVIIFLVITGGKSGTAPPTNVGEKIAGTSQKITAYAADTDKDELPDWEEVVRGTDPENPDTDGDGTPDGEEVGLGRDPLKPGPNDKVVNPITILRPGKYQLPQTSRPAMNTPGQNQQNTVISQPTQSPAPQETELQKKLRAFANSAGVIFKQYADITKESPIFEKSIKQYSKGVSDSLKILAGNHEVLANKLSALPTPNGAEKIVSNLISSQLSLSAAIETLAESDTGTTTIPAEKFVAYSDKAVTAAASILDFMKYLKTSGIAFSQNEDGYMFQLP